MYVLPHRYTHTRAYTRTHLNTYTRTYTHTLACAHIFRKRKIVIEKDTHTQAVWRAKVGMSWSQGGGPRGLGVHLTVKYSTVHKALGSIPSTAGGGLF